MAAQDNKYLTFQLAKEHYAIPILTIKEIIGMMPITTVPKLPRHIKGVINLRGKIIPVVDLRLKFGLDSQAYDERTAIIVMQQGSKMSGIVVDTVQEVQDILPEAIEPPPSHGTDIDQSFLTGMGKVSEHVIMMLDAPSLLASGEGGDLLSS